MPAVEIPARTDFRAVPERLTRWEPSGEPEALCRYEERRLVRRAQEGDRAAMERLVAANERLVRSVARRYRCRSHSTEDLLQEGVLGLIQAIQRFNPDHNCRLSTYALHWIRQAIARAASCNDRLIHVPAQATAAVRRLRRVQDAREQELGRELREEELAEVCGMDETRLGRLITALQDAVSYDAPAGEEGASSLLELAEDPSAVDPEFGAVRESYRQQVRHLVGTLRPRDREVLARRYGLDNNAPRTLEDLAREMRMTREGVRQIETRALRRLRHALRSGQWE